MNDAEAYMLLVLSNAQSEPSPLEIGLHALHYVELAHPGRGEKDGLNAYARAIHKSKQYVSQVRHAAEVFETVREIVKSTGQFLDKAQHFQVIHAAPQALWPALAQAMLGGQSSPGIRPG